MDDHTLDPRASARSRVTPSQTPAGVGTRVRPARPIRFTPSRTEPLHPPAPHPHAAETPSFAARLAVWLLLAIGWGIFAAWWVIVLHRESARSLGVAVGLIAATVVASAIATWLWTGHNIRIAKKGNRGRSSMFIPLQWERDTLGRALDLPATDAARTAPEVRVVLRGKKKAYLVVDAEEL